MSLNSIRAGKRSLGGFACLALSLMTGPMAWVATATETGASVYPAGVETVMPGMTPLPGASMLLEFSNFYQANVLADGKGQSEIPGFHLRVGGWP